MYTNIGIEESFLSVNSELLKGKSDVLLALSLREIGKSRNRRRLRQTKYAGNSVVPLLRTEGGGRVR